MRNGPLQAVKSLYIGSHNSTKAKVKDWKTVAVGENSIVFAYGRSRAHWKMVSFYGSLKRAIESSV